MWGRNTNCVPPTHPWQGPNPQLKHMPWPGIKLQPFGLRDDAPINWATLTRAKFPLSTCINIPQVISGYISHLFVHAVCLPLSKTIICRRFMQAPLATSKPTVQDAPHCLSVFHQNLPFHASSLNRITIFQLFNFKNSEAFLFLLSASPVNIQHVIVGPLELNCNLLILDSMNEAIFYPISCFLISWAESTFLPLLQRSS